MFPATIIRSKGMFWLASRPEQALIWGQAGGSLKADSAGVWWDSMPYRERTRYLAFVENQQEIESDWSATFGDRKNEIVFIGQDLDKVEITAELEACLLTAEELKTERWKEGYADNWPVERTYALNN